MLEMAYDQPTYCVTDMSDLHDSVMSPCAVYIS